ncbi:DNA translocase FtsK 4TM domain-containing protein [Campylobacter fetus]|uniref:DNA translocase FtsK n=7 Tax=Campylobacter fetus TaxID=196 RepID=A0A5L4IHJ6_CAMFE|nr:DNA translocase FtsK [Campylobacter fetus subsp. fetus 82-40]AHE93972.1 DNA segregation ATPase FtsK/SpoIIIE [Campylobacter fetus subsp. venerealis cfvi03/293]AIR80338.1 DNA segregation ATPase FtsK/SpoIIIE [Campylobacter fetus subsp. venerealis 97/608]EAI3886231.1 DNA translocase FtsK [Campylobacter fetus]KAA3684737.1 DNA translocase FtsK [Campylobacter fetus subsp. fetus]KAA3685318.1 DNA translocase FtsK [Campylobacter fetus subsp. venerealis]QEL44646.1 DNA segregation ATPase FtsK/SpoIIIE 
MLIISVCILIFFGVATIVPNASFVGTFGNILGSFNYKLFGFLAYIYPFLLLYPAILNYKNFKKFNIKLLGNIIGALLLFFAILLLISMFDKSYGGAIGTFCIEALRSVIGSVGSAVFILMIFFISFGLVFDDRLDIVLKKAFVDRVSASDNLNLKAHYIPKKQKNDVKKIEVDLAINSKIIDDKLEIKNDVSSLEPTENIIDIKEANSLKDDNNTNPMTTIGGVEILNEVAENRELLNQIEKGKVEKPKDFKLPPLSFLNDPPKRSKNINESEIDQKIADLLDKLRRFKIDGDVVRTYSGPVVTTFEFKPAAHVKVSKILTLQDDLAMALKAQTIRIQAPIPGKDVVGIEIPNKNIETIYLKEILESDIYKNAKSELTLALGKDIVGDPFITDLKKLPHLLIAGTTGSGKSVGINAMLLSLLYRNSPKTLRLIMIDPKMLEFSMYNDIPHLLTPVITEPKKAISVLSNLVAEMERRYKIMSETKTKNIETYNEKIKKDGGETLPFIVVIIDELADLMMTSGKEVEFHIGRLAQMARASGIHLIVATQRPSVDVVTGLIKANLPSRISYRVGQKIDSKVILDQMGAESLLGRGDMLFTPPGSPGIVRLHAPFASEKEIEEIVDFLKEQQDVVYEESFLKDESSAVGSSENGLNTGETDELYEEAKSIILSEEKTSISYLQRRLKIGYNRAASIIEQLEIAGVLTPVNAKGQRDIIR